MFSSFADDAGLEERPFTQQKKPLAKAWPDPESLNEIFDLAINAKKPVFIGGHGVWWSSAEKKLEQAGFELNIPIFNICLLYTSPSPRDQRGTRMPSSA